MESLRHEQLLVLSPPAKHALPSPSAAEERLGICLAKFPPRVKLGFGAVACGKHKTFDVEVQVPAAKQVDTTVQLVVSQTYQRGKQVPQILTVNSDSTWVCIPGSASPQQIPFAQGTDRINLRVQYAPDIEDNDGVMGSISLQCNVAGLLVKGELMVTGKATAVMMQNSKVGQLSARSLTVGPKGPVSLGTNKQLVRPPLPSHASHNGTNGHTASIASKPLASRAINGGLTTPKRTSGPGSSLHHVDQDITSDMPSSPACQFKLSSSGSPASNSPASSVCDDTAVNRDQGPVFKIPAPKPVGSKPHTSGVALKRSLSLSSAGQPAQASGLHRTTSGIDSIASTPKHKSFSTAGPPSACGTSTPTHRSGSFSISSVSRAKQASQSHSPIVAVKVSRSYLTVHAEGPLLKQERALTAWLNSKLATPQQQPGGDAPAPALTLQRMSAQAQGLLWRLYKRDPQVFASLKIVYAKIDAGVFSLSETPLVADIRGVQEMVDPLLSYHTFWLRAALVTVLRGDLVGSGQHGAVAAASTEALHAAARKGVAVLIREGLLYERVVGCAADKQGCWMEHRGLILKNFLLLVLLLDRIVTNPDIKLPTGSPPLFNLRAPLKSSHEVVRTFLHQRLSGMGDALHHLDRWGYRLTAVQAPLDEFDYGVTNLREDLRSGIRLAKLYEQITGCHSLLRGNPPLWLHPVADTQAIDNMSRVLAKWQTLGVVPNTGQRILTQAGPQPLRCRDLVDANREITLGVLWNIALKWQLPHLIKCHTLQVETKRLHRQLCTRLKRPAPEPLDVFPEQRYANALHKWTQAACALQGLRIHNFTSSIGDGRALCYLVSTYVPDLLPVSSVYQPDAPKPEEVAILIEGDEDVDMDTLRAKGWCAVYEAGGYIDDKGLLMSYKDGVRRNFSLLHTAVAQLGQVPQMLSPEDFLDGGLDERSVILYVGHLASRLLELSREQRAAHIITAALRKYIWSKKYGPQQQHLAAVTIQKYWRRHAAQQAVARMRDQQNVEAERQQQERRHAAACCIQVAWREHRSRVKAVIAGVLVRHAQLVAERKVAREAAAATTIQAHWRAYLASAAYNKQLQAICQLQAAIRCRTQRRSFFAQKAAAVLIQSHIRAYLTRLQQHRHHAAAAKVQAYWRGYLAQTRYHQTRKGIIRLQAIARGSAVRRDITKQKHAATIIQAAWRGFTVRQRVAQQHAAATQIQAAWRGHKAQKASSSLRRAAVTIQAAWRARSVLQQQLQLQRSATAIQAAWRGTVVRKQLAIRHHAATRIQAAYRSHVNQKAYQSQRQAVVRLQAAWRGHVVRQQIEQHKHSATVMQAAWRGYVTRKRMQALHASATKIQAVYRGHLTRSSIGQQRMACICIQTAYRGWSIRKQLTSQHAAATRIQAYWRGYNDRKQLQNQHAAATAIQTAWRVHSTMQQYHLQRQAACTIQSCWRTRTVLGTLQTQHRVATSIQALWRGHKARQHLQNQHTSATCIQSAWRMHAAEKEYKSLYHAAVLFQNAWRSRTIQKQVSCMHTAATSIQSAWRSHKAKSVASEVRNAAAILQAYGRAWAVRQELQNTTRACTTIQSAWRGYQTRHWLASQHQAATCIQKHWRGWTAAQHYTSCQAAATTIQAYVRCWQARCQHQQMQAAATLMQGAWRAKQSRCLLAQHQAAARIQAAVRGHAVRMQLKQWHAAATVLQTAWRAKQARRQYHATKKRVIMIQSCARGWMARNKAEERRGAIVLLQSFWRRQLAWRQAAAVRAERHTAAVMLQTAVRGWLARRAAHQRQQRIVTVQAVARSWLARKQAVARRVILELEATAKLYMRRLVSARRIQAWWRGHLVRVQTGPILSELRQQRRRKRAVGVIEVAYLQHRARQQAAKRQAALQTLGRAVPLIRAWLQRCRAVHAQQQAHEAATCIQAYARALPVRLEYRRNLRRIVQVQALWRGWKLRQTDGKLKAEMRKKLAAAAEVTAKNPHKTLGARVRDALEQLLARKDPAQLSMAIAAMETGTRYSPACCELIATEEGASALLRLARSLNRSKPHTDLLISILAVLHNICRHASLIPLVLNAADSITTLSERLQFFRDSEEVFMPTVLLVAKLLTAPGAPLKVAVMPGILKQWEGIAQIILRRMEMERKYISRLEGQKGSDVSAKEATRKLLLAGKQLEALQGIITTVTVVAEAHGVQVEHHNMVPHSNPAANNMPVADTKSVPETVVPAAPATAKCWQPRNTLVRGVLKEVTQMNAVQQQLAAVQAAAVAAVVSGQSQAPIAALAVVDHLLGNENEAQTAPQQQQADPVLQQVSVNTVSAGLAAGLATRVKVTLPGPSSSRAGQRYQPRTVGGPQSATAVLQASNSFKTSMPTSPSSKSRSSQQSLRASNDRA